MALKLYLHMFELIKVAAVSLVLVAVACSPPDSSADSDARASSSIASISPGVEAISFLGDTLEAPAQPEAVRAVYMERYKEAERALAGAPTDVDSLIWMGRRTAYLGHYRDAINVYSEGIGLHPGDARLYRHRGHRYLSVRELGKAITDLERAAELTKGRRDEVEPDGLPNSLNIPTSTLQFNIWYHLALAHYVAGDFEAALDAQRSCMKVSVHPDSVVATAYWMYMTMRRLGLRDEAQELLDSIDVGMEIIESVAYLDLLLLFKGERSFQDLIGPNGDAPNLQSTTTSYGIGVWHLLNGRQDDAHELWERILEGRNQWAAFGYISAEGELARSAVR